MSRTGRIFARRAAHATQCIRNETRSAPSVLFAARWPARYTGPMRPRVGTALAAPAALALALGVLPACAADPAPVSPRAAARDLRALEERLAGESAVITSSAEARAYLGRVERGYESFLALHPGTPEARRVRLLLAAVRLSRGDPRAEEDLERLAAKPGDEEAREAAALLTRHRAATRPTGPPTSRGASAPR